jgi:hypothetical protein
MVAGEEAIMRRRLRAGVILGALVVAFSGTIAGTAYGEVIEGACTGSITFSDGTKVTESQPLNEVVDVPPADTVTYEGMTGTPKPTSPVGFAGSVDVKLPVMTWVVVSWSGETEENSDDGTYTYDVPSFVPRGTGGFEVTAFHNQQGENCVVAVTMRLDGDPGPAAILGVALTGIFAAGVGAAGIKKKG